MEIKTLDEDFEAKRAAYILNSMTTPIAQLNTLVRTDCRDKDLLIKWCEIILNNYVLSEDYMSSPSSVKLFEWYKNLVNYKFPDKIKYIDFTNKDQEFIFVLESYLYIFNVHCLIFDVKYKHKLADITICKILDNFSTSLERFISLKYFPYLLNLSLLKCIIVIFDEYKLYNDNLFNIMTKFAFSNKNISEAEKIETTNVLSLYITGIPGSERKLTFVRKLCNTFREIGQCDHLGVILTSSVSY